MGEWLEKRMDEIADFNPRESLPKGTIAKKIAMDKLQPFCRDVPGFEMEAFSGGTKFRNGDTIMARITPCLENGKTAKVDVLENNEVGFGSTEYIVFRAKEGNDSDFVYYLVISPEVREPAIKSMVGSSGRQRVQIDVVQSLKVRVPDLEGQRVIAGILKTLDDKIAVNRRVNDNLAEQAQGVLYHFMDEHPYQLQPLSDIAIVIDCLHSKKPSAVEDSAYQLIQLDNIRDDGFLDMSATRYMISQADYENWTRKCEIVEGDCVITNVGRIGAVSQAPYGTKAAMGRNMTCIRLKPEIKLQAYFITVLLSNHMRRQIQSNTDEGTIMGALNVKNIPKLLFPVFEPSVMTEFEAILFPLRKQIEYNNLQNQNLSQLRDTLLPKLISGELDVSDIDI